MRDYGKVYSTFWSSPTTGALSLEAKTLALYLMTCPHSTITGVFRMPDGYASEDLGWTPERVAEGFAELLRKGFANRCETTKWVWVIKHLKWNPPDNPNQRKAAAKVALTVPDECAWKPEFMRLCGPLLGLEVHCEANPSETVREPIRNQGQKTEGRKQEQKEEGGAADQRSDAGTVKAKKRASRDCPLDFVVSADMVAWAKTNAPGVDIEHETQTFRLHERQKPVTDWPKAWKGWILKAKEFASERRPGRAGSAPRSFADNPDYYGQAPNV